MSPEGVLPVVVGAGSADSEPTLRNRKVQKAYSYGDTTSLAEAHENIDLDNVPDHTEATEGFGGDYIKSFVFGGLDGIVSTFALVAGLGGADVPIGTLIAVSMAKVLADAFSMGFGEFTSATAELEAAMKIKNREEWEMEHNMDGEVKEMAQLYMQKGCSREDSLTILSVMSNYKDLFLEHMMAVEHGILAPDDSDKWQPLKQGFVCFLAFACFGLVPLAGFVVYYAMVGNSAKSSSFTVLAIAYGLTVLTLFIMGLTKARLTGSDRVLKSGLMMVFNGTFAGGVAYLVGEGLVAALA